MASSVLSCASSDKSRAASSLASAPASEARSDVSSVLAADKEQVLTNKMRHIVTHFRKRAFNVRKQIEEPNSLGNNVLDTNVQGQKMYRLI